jgi:hypothetical protein
MHANSAPANTGAMKKNRFGRQDRIAYYTVSAGAASILLIARLLHPSPTGVGTHEQLGLPACPFYHFTGLPCPTCGFTTSFAYGARLDLLNSFFTNPAGFVLFLLTALSIPLCILLVWLRVERGCFSRLPFPGIIGYGTLLLLLLSWAYKLLSMKSYFLESLKNW